MRCLKRSDLLLFSKYDRNLFFSFSVYCARRLKRKMSSLFIVFQLCIARACIIHRTLYLCVSVWDNQSQCLLQMKIPMRETKKKNHEAHTQIFLFLDRYTPSFFFVNLNTSMILPRAIDVKEKTKKEKLEEFVLRERKRNFPLLICHRWQIE